MNGLQLAAVALLAIAVVVFATRRGRTWADGPHPDTTGNTWTPKGGDQP